MAEEAFFCPDCDDQICSCTIERIRLQERAMIGAKQALQSLDALNNKLTKEKNMALEELGKWKEKAERKEQADLNKKMDAIDRQFYKLTNRSKLS